VHARDAGHFGVVSVTTLSGAHACMHAHRGHLELTFVHGPWPSMAGHAALPAERAPCTQVLLKCSHVPVRQQRVRPADQKHGDRVDTPVPRQRVQGRVPVPPLITKLRAVMCFGWVFFLISSGSPHVLRAHMGVHRTCGEPTKSN